MKLVRTAIVIAAAALPLACESLSDGYTNLPTEWGGGVTQGGAQDIGFARQVIAEGGVPTSDAIIVEGLLSEHDLPVAGPPCERLMCVRPSVGTAPRLSTGETVTWVQVGMASGLPSPFQRPPIDLVVALDTGGSMVGDIAEVEEAVVALIEHMTPDDNLAIVAFGEAVYTVRQLGRVEDKAALAATVRGIRASGPSPILDGMEAAYRLLPGVDDPQRLARVMVFACDYPWGDAYELVSATIDAGAARGIGTSYFGVLLGFDAELADILGQAHGGSFHFLDTLERVEQVFDQDFDLMVTPLAYDLTFELRLDDGVSVAALFGVPGDDLSARPSFTVATAFPSRNHGAVVAALRAPDDASSIGGAHLSYRPEAALAGVGDDASDETVVMSVVAPVDDGEVAFDGPGVRIAVALVNQAEQMMRACDAYHAGDVEAAVSITTELRDYLQGEADALDDDGLRTEVALVTQLLTNLQSQGG